MKLKMVAGALALLLVLGALAGCARREEAPEESKVDEDSSAVNEPSPSSPASSVPDEVSEPDEESSEESEPEASEEESSEEDAYSEEVGVIYARAQFASMTGFGGERQTRVGTQAELDALKAQLAQVGVDGTALSAAVMPGDYTKDYLFNEAQVEQLAGMLRALEPTLLPEEELGNPATGGGWDIHVDGPQEMLITYSGWLVVEYPNQGDRLVFQAGTADAFQGIGDYLREKIESIHE